MERVPNESDSFQVFHNMAVTYLRCEFPLPALELLERALRLADNEVDRAFTYASMAGAYTMASLHEEDPNVARRHVDSGIYAATRGDRPRGTVRAARDRHRVRVPRDAARTRPASTSARSATRMPPPTWPASTR